MVALQAAHSVTMSPFLHPAARGTQSLAQHEWDGKGVAGRLRQPQAVPA